MFKLFTSASKILTKIFSNDKALIEINSSNQSQNHDNSKSKRIKNGNDNSINANNSSVNITYDHSSTNIDKSVQHYQVLNDTETDLIIHARWHSRVVYDVKPVQDVVGTYMVGVPRDPNYVQPSLNICFDEEINKDGGIYFCVAKNLTIKNLRIISIELSLDTCQTSITETRDILGIIDTNSSFVVFGKGFNVGNGNINVVFAFCKDNTNYKQRFSFSATDDSKEFVLKRYDKPENCE